ncbi:hypothetical protein F3Y22_tig00110847pilonHSYRG00050 [Hibiscus syriacus]|uniref:Response regulatory domain-containing protein n=1 Tax=Hibiscus syriacus TaxID=106335 RepID=A0A6A2ZKY7_HIBSY|nr:hypothetical protein F3Y22_tig00110847pilonHSYRG00050 [Hibiscus syriacus]
MHLGCDATTVGSRDECLRLVSHEHKVVFVDISVPGTDGHRITGRIHEKLAKRNERPLIVALTGNTDKLTKENCMRIGMDGLILKPISLDKMRSVLTDLLENRVLFEGI